MEDYEHSSRELPRSLARTGKISVSYDRNTNPYDKDVLAVGIRMENGLGHIVRAYKLPDEESSMISGNNEGDNQDIEFVSIEHFFEKYNPVSANNPNERLQSDEYFKPNK